MISINQYIYEKKEEPDPKQPIKDKVKEIVKDNTIKLFRKVSSKLPQDDIKKNRGTDGTTGIRGDNKDIIPTPNVISKK